MRHLRFLLVSSLILSACLTAAEMGRRILDGYDVWSLGLVKDPSSTDLTWSDSRPTEALLRTIKLDIEADSSWFYDRPQPIQGTAPEWAETRRTTFEPGANYIWNAATINDPGLQAYLQKNRAGLEEIFTFRPPNGERYPLYRFYPEIQTGFGFTNRFGWRSRQITAEKPPNVIRIGFLGDSTTNTYPGMVEHWLNLWAVRRKLGVRFEIINAARPASGALDAAAIFDVEFGSIDPDYVIIYGFGNGIYVADALIKLPPGLVKGQPATATAAGTGIVAGLSKRVSAKLEPLVRWSAAAGFLRNRVMGQRGGKLSPEPPKPTTQMAFPPGIDEGSPNPEKIASYGSGGLMALETYLQGLNKIDVMAKSRNIRLFVSTFRITAFDGMLLGKGDPNNGGIIYSVINEQYWWPYTYAQIHRLMAFYNRTLRAWAETKGHDIIPINEQMPWRPELYGDGMHELPVGEALHAWIVLQQLMPRIRDDLAQHRLPRPAPFPHRDVEQYWKIERTNVAAAIDSVVPNTPHTPPPRTPPEPAEDIAGAFPLSKIVLAYAKAEIVPGDVPLIRTAMEPFAYAAFVPIEASAAAGLTGKGWVGVRIKVNEGRISVGVLNKSAQKFLAQASLDRTPDIQEVYLMLEDLSDVGSLMISNNRPGETARSVAELHSVVLKRLR
jgi:hypothetical protein